MLQLEGNIGAVLERPISQINGRILVKVGFSSTPRRRQDEHNATLPPAGRLRWKLKLKSQAFVNGADAKQADDTMKANFARHFESLGGEFFLGGEAELTSAFSAAAAPAAFRIVATKRP